uniref:MaoC family dehydratase n=1 Tax=Ningiella ruwaisensis TaxID=2364274 RepID=UPI0010A02F59|nr:MaoC/PaaZ C-terminal domain-containing protein [Ningiella ruwaisensis]
MLALLAKAAIYRPEAQSLDIGALSQMLERAEVPVLPSHYHRYHFLVKWPSLTSSHSSDAPLDTIHPCYAQVLSLPLQMKLMTRAPFPFKAFGLIHIANKINVISLPLSNQTLQLHAYFGRFFSHPKGVVFELNTDLSVKGILAVKASSYYLATNIDSVNKQGLPDFADYKDLQIHFSLKNEKQYDPVQSEQILSFDDSIGRDYARASGDYNPIHLWPATAKLFGFKRAIAHGMYSKALVLSKVQEQKAISLNQGMSLVTVFKRPVLLPSQAHLQLTEQNDGMLFKLSNRQNKQSSTHMIGAISKLQS